MSKFLTLMLFTLVFVSCRKGDVQLVEPEPQPFTIIRGVDISSLPEISLFNPTFYNAAGNEQDFLDILKANGVNTIRLRLWVNPDNSHSGFEEVKWFSESLKAKGFKTWLCVHYSDTWADPGHQETPVSWQGIGMNALHDSVYHYTKKLVDEMTPDYIQIGNEINTGFLHPYGAYPENTEQFTSLLDTAIAAVKSNPSPPKIILHYAGTSGAEYFFSDMDVLDYDFIGLSYYPLWHGKSLDSLKSKMSTLHDVFGKRVLVAETAYPFTLGWNDWTNNIVGLEEQLILPEYPSNAEGQRKFMEKIHDLCLEVEDGLGFCYWGGELIAWKGIQAANTSPWENQALFDFDNKVLPVITTFHQR